MSREGQESAAYVLALLRKFRARKGVGEVIQILLPPPQQLAGPLPPAPEITLPEEMIKGPSITFPPVIYIKTRGYQFHNFSSFSFPAASTSSAPTVASFYDLPNRCDLILVSVTQPAMVEFDRAPTQDTPILAAGQSLNAPMQVKRIYAIGTTPVSGLINLFAWW